MKTINLMFEDSEWKKIVRLKSDLKKKLNTPILSWKDVILISLNLKDGKKYEKG